MNPINKKRLYEITGLHPDDGYNADIIGSVIQPTSLKISPVLAKHYGGGFNMICASEGYARLSTGYAYGVTLRPLTQKEQEKIDANQETR